MRDTRRVWVIEYKDKETSYTPMYFYGLKSEAKEELPYFKRLYPSDTKFRIVKYIPEGNKNE